MLGVYDYTVILTYMSLISATMGIFLTLEGEGNPYIGVICLAISGICDAFDGVVARSKKNRTDFEKRFGIQIDSLTDLIAFGVLPACIAAAMPIRINVFVFYIIILWYVLAALIRLAYFNVTEEIRQDEEEGRRQYYEGLPVTSAAIIFPIILMIQRFTSKEMTQVYFFVMLLVAFAFVSKIKVKKPGKR